MLLYHVNWAILRFLMAFQKCSYCVLFQILPTAQRLLDELLSSQQTAINTVCGAPGKTIILHLMFICVASSVMLFSPFKTILCKFSFGWGEIEKYFNFNLLFNLC